MPRYDYKCKKCGIIEIEHRMNEKIEECPKCKGKIKKLISSSDFILKGEGWTPKHYGDK